MNITVIAKLGNQEEYASGQNAESKSEIFESISQTYTNDDIDRIEIKYDDIEAVTLGGGRTTEPGVTATATSLEELRAELGKFTG